MQQFSPEAAAPTPPPVGRAPGAFAAAAAEAGERGGSSWRRAAPAPLSSAHFFPPPGAPAGGGARRGAGLVNLCASRHPLRDSSLTPPQPRGNTCYLNATLAVLAAQTCFSNDLLAFSAGGPLAAALRGTLRELTAASAAAPRAPQRPAFPQLGPPPVAPRRLQAAAGASAGGGRFGGNAQQDAHDFLLHLLEGVRSELCAAESPRVGGAPRRPPPLSATRCAVRRSFTAITAETLACCGCGAASARRELHRALSLPLPAPAGGSDGAPAPPPPAQHATFFGAQAAAAAAAAAQASLPPLPLAGLLDSFFAEEMLQRRCEACGHPRARLSRALSRAPRLLVLHLKRYRPVAAAPPPPGAAQVPLVSAWAKSSRRVAPPSVLDLSRHLAAGCKPPPPRRAPPPGAADGLGAEAEEAAALRAALRASAEEAEAAELSRALAASAAEAGGAPPAPPAAAADDELLAEASESGSRGGSAEAAAAEESAAESDAENGGGGGGNGGARPALYDLRAVVCHVGAAMNRGHYTADARGPGGEWERHNDERVTALAEHDTVLSSAAKQSEAYILVYELREPAARAAEPLQPRAAW